MVGRTCGEDLEGVMLILRHYPTKNICSGSHSCSVFTNPQRSLHCMNLSRPHSMTTMRSKCLVLRDVMGHEEWEDPQTPPGSAAGPSPPSAVVQPLPVIPSLGRRGWRAYGFSFCLFLSENWMTWVVNQKCYRTGNKTWFKKIRTDGHMGPFLENENCHKVWQYFSLEQRVFYFKKWVIWWDLQYVF